MKTGENIYKRKDGRWEGRYIKDRKGDGKICYGYIYGKKLGEVKTRLFEQKMANYQFYLNTGKRGPAVTLEAWALDWLFTLKASVKYNTYINYKGRLLNHVLPRIGKYELAKLTESALNQLLLELAEELSESSVHSIYRMLFTCLKDAKKQKLISENPLQHISLPKKKNTAVVSFSQLDQKKIERQAVTEADFPIIIALYTGVRIGELCALKWSDIDWQQKTIKIQRNAQRVIDETLAKTRLQEISLKTKNSLRTIPMTNTVHTLLLKLAADDHGTDDFIFVGRDGCSAIDPRSIRYRFAKLKQRSQVADLPFHALRHTFATRCIEAGVTVTTVSALLGHSSVKLTLDIYTNSFLSEKRLAVDKLEALCNS